MSPVTVIIIVAIVLIGSFALTMLFLPPYLIFINTLYRSDRKERTRECTVDNEDIRKMVEFGRTWAAGYKDVTDELHIVNDGLNLYGEYVNLGFDKSVIIVQGRTESLLYSYYFADLYAKNGYNILVIDSRVHGFSDGKYITAGIKEHTDVIKWIEYIKERYSQTSIVLHGICIGSATSVYTYCATKNENVIDKMVLDGLFTSYYEMFRNHIIERKKPIFCYIYVVFFYLYLVTGVNVLKNTPRDRMHEIDIPVLFLWSNHDIYCLKDKNEELFDMCASPHKEVRFFSNGGHSFVRFHNMEEYDETIVSFLKRHP